MLTVSDIDEGSIAAKAKSLGWEQDFDESFLEPILIMREVAAFMQMNDAQRREFRRVNPEHYKKVTERIQRIQAYQEE